MSLHRPGALLLLAASALAASACAHGALGILDEAEPTEEAEEAPPATAPEDEEPLDTVVSFRDRSIDLEPHVAGFPYAKFRPLPELGVLVYQHIGPRERTLRVLPLDSEPNLESGRRLTGEDWNTRNLVDFEPLPDDNALLALADEDNHEDWDLYRIDLEGGGSIQRLTDVPYIYGFGLDMPRRRVGFVARYPREDGSETYESCLELLSLDGGEVSRVVCDVPELSFTWTDVQFSEDGRFAWIRANTTNDRNLGNLVRIDMEAKPPRAEQVTPDARRGRLRMLEGWLDEDNFAYLSDESGFTNLWTSDIEGKQHRALTTLQEELSAAALLEGPDGARLLGVVKRPWESEVLLLHPDGEVLARQVIEANLYSLGSHEGRAWFWETSRRHKVRILQVDLDDSGGFAVRPFLELPPELEAKLSHCTVERVSIPTFDIDPHTGEPRELHAYWSVPTSPPAEGQSRLAGIVAFYGGSNSFDMGSQIFCQAGIASLSPAVRGSWGFGQEFSGLNDKDLGGDEIVDLHWMAKWLVEEKGYLPRNIGAYGGSHGGYATMRALTFPPETNDRSSDFDWGWGVSYFGFSDIRTFWQDCNIPDWVLLEAGDPEAEPEKIRDRSPLYHLDKLDSPILLLHGENDQRVPVRESRQFQAACEAISGPCTYVEFPGQGHGLKGIENQVRVWRSIFSFLETLPTTQPAP